MSKPTLLVALVLMSMYGIAEAAQRGVCLELRFKDNRNSAQCADVTEPGNLRGCSPGNDVDHRGAVLELWDKDPDGSDERIGRVTYLFEGGTCWDFEWDNNLIANAEREANPDVYALWVNEVMGPQNSRTVTARQQSGIAHLNVSWRNGEVGDPNRYVANECTTGIDCWIFPSGWLLPSTDVNTSIARRAMALDSAQHALEIFSGIMTTNVVMRIPDTTCPTGCAASRSLIRVPDGLMEDGVLITHEVAHTVQMQQFNRDSLRDDVSNSGSGWDFTTVEFDSGSTTEGWASYAALASWYDPGNPASVPQGWGYDFEEPVPHSAVCAENRAFALQVAKGFWDFDDVNNEPGAGIAGAQADLDSWATVDVTTGWSLFPPGTANRQNFESDMHGVNVRDFRFNTNAFFGNSPTMFQTLLNHNCLQSQDDG
jgi:hypothetical protein